MFQCFEVSLKLFTRCLYVDSPYGLVKIRLFCVLEASCVISITFIDGLGTTLLTHAKTD